MVAVIATLIVWATRIGSTANSAPVLNTNRTVGTRVVAAATGVAAVILADFVGRTAGIISTPRHAIVPQTNLTGTTVRVVSPAPCIHASVIDTLLTISAMPVNGTFDLTTCVRETKSNAGTLPVFETVHWDTALSATYCKSNTLVIVSTFHIDALVVITDCDPTALVITGTFHSLTYAAITNRNAITLVISHAGRSATHAFVVFAGTPA